MKNFIIVCAFVVVLFEGACALYVDNVKWTSGPFAYDPYWECYIRPHIEAGVITPDVQEYMKEVLNGQALMRLSS